METAENHDDIHSQLNREEQEQKRTAIAVPPSPPHHNMKAFAGSGSPASWRFRGVGLGKDDLEAALDCFDRTSVLGQ